LQRAFVFELEVHEARRHRGKVPNAGKGNATEGKEGLSKKRAATKPRREGATEDEERDFMEFSSFRRKDSKTACVPGHPGITTKEKVWGIKKDRRLPRKECTRDFASGSSQKKEKREYYDDKFARKSEKEERTKGGTNK